MNSIKKAFPPSTIRCSFPPLRAPGRGKAFSAGDTGGESAVVNVAAPADFMAWGDAPVLFNI
jgi:hypothetical protein